MKKLFSLVIVALMGASAMAAVSNQPSAIQPVTVIVMDTTQALLNGAEVKIGKQVWRTSFDGRVLLEQKDVENVKSLSVSCEGYESQTASFDGSLTVLVVLTPKPRKSDKEMDGFYSFSGHTKSGKRYERAVTDEGDYVMAEARVDAAPSVMVEESGESYMPTVSGSANNALSAGKLTAGEVNDFAKWYFWSRVIDGSHQEYVVDWQVAPRHRYTVQVTNRRGYPIVNRAVSLLDNNGNTIYQAVTDNTGKAELWYQLISTKSCGKHAGLKVRVDDEVKDAKEWNEGLNTFIVDEVCEASENVDVMFVFDATGSMGDELRYLQAEMKDVIARAEQATGGLAIRTGAVVYRDHGDKYLTRISRLTENIKTTQAFIDKQSAGGGGDYPEAVPEALMAALNSAGWDSNARARIAFLVLDAPCHQDSVTLSLLHEQILNAAAAGVRIVPVVCSGLQESGELLMRSIALATNGTSLFLTDDSGIGDTHLKPTTDSLKVEPLNDMLVRTIVEFSTIPNCEGKWGVGSEENENDAYIPNPFDVKDLTAEERKVKDSRTTLYLLDITGKLIYVYEGRLEDAGDSQLSRLPIPMLSTGVYFVKAFYDGEWHTRKILVH